MLFGLSCDNLSASCDTLPFVDVLISVLGNRDAEIERGVEELIALVAGYPRDNPEMALGPG